ncbi:MAG: Bax inhibitor-1/YccA family protein [Acidiferrobacteraceae bacterium]
MDQNPQVVQYGRPSELTTNTVLRKTYVLLAATLLFSAGAAWYSMATHVSFINPWMMLLIYFGLLFATNALRNSPAGVVAVFALTGFLGYTLGPLLSFYLKALPNGREIIFYALGTTGLVFLTLSAYAITTRKNFSYMGGFLVTGMIIAFVASIANLFLHMPVLMLVTSSIFVLVMSGWILYQTSAIINGGETNYIVATVNLYVALYDIFVSLLQIFGVMGGRD